MRQDYELCHMISLIAVGACRYWNHDNTQNVWITKTNDDVLARTESAGLALKVFTE